MGLIAVAVCLLLLLLVLILVYCRKKEGLDSDVADSSILTSGFQPVSIKPSKAGGVPPHSQHSCQAPTPRTAQQVTSVPPPESVFTLADNPHLLTIQPDLSTTTTTCQGSLCPRQDGPSPKFQLANGHLLSPLGGGRHTLHHSSPTSEAEDFVSRLSTQNYFRSLPRGTSNMTYGTFNFLGGRLMIPNTGENDSRVPQGALRGKTSLVSLLEEDGTALDVFPGLLTLTLSAKPGTKEWGECFGENPVMAGRRAGTEAMARVSPFCYFRAQDY